MLLFDRVLLLDSLLVIPYSYSTMAENTNSSNLKNNGLIVLLVVAAFVIGTLWNKVQTLEKGGGTGTQQAGNDTAPEAQAPERPAELKIQKPDSGKDHWTGSKQARFVLVEYTDLECPFCKANDPTPPKLLKDFGNKLAHVSRHFPLSFHPKAQDSAEATECAAEIGGEQAFWKMRAAIFAAMPDMPLTDLPKIAAAQGVNEAKFKTCLDSNKHEKKVKDQLSEGSTAGVAATPTTVVYDMKTGKTQLIEGAVPYDQQKTTVESFIKQQEG